MVTLVSFADSRMKPSLARLGRQASRLQQIDQVLLLSEDDLSSEYRANAGDRLNRRTRGFGYWCWKPEVMLMALSRVNRNDIVIYCDAGFHLNPRGGAHLQRYLAPLEAEQVDLVAFAHDLSIASFRGDQDRLPNFAERRWTKGDMLDFWGARNLASATESPQYCGGLFAVRKTERVIELMTKWREDALRRPELFDDSPSASPNLEGFIENRHDQSYFSLLCKQTEHVAFSAFEFWYPALKDFRPDWETIRDFPFHAKRDKQFGGLRRFWQPAFRLTYKVARHVRRTSNPLQRASVEAFSNLSSLDKIVPTQPS